MCFVSGCQYRISTLAAGGAATTSCPVCCPVLATPPARFAAPFVSTFALQSGALMRKCHWFDVSRQRQCHCQCPMKAAKDQRFSQLVIMRSEHVSVCMCVWVSGVWFDVLCIRKFVRKSPICLFQLVDTILWLSWENIYGNKIIEFWQWLF